MSTGKMIRSIGAELIYLEMEVNMKDYGKRIVPMEKESWF